MYFSQLYIQILVSCASSVYLKRICRPFDQKVALAPRVLSIRMQNKAFSLRIVLKHTAKKKKQNSQESVHNEKPFTARTISHRSRNIPVRSHFWNIVRLFTFIPSQRFIFVLYKVSAFFRVTNKSALLHARIQESEFGNQFVYMYIYVDENCLKHEQIYL